VTDDAPAARAMQIGEVAERSGLSLRTLRHYDEIGLLRPSARTEGGFRLYTQADLDRLLVIRRMKPLGFSLEAMQQVMATVAALEASEQPDEALQARLREVLAEARERRQRLQDQLAMADEFIDQLTRRLP
jgi:DNA-binding transcriptional MerR regulator